MATSARSGDGIMPSATRTIRINNGETRPARKPKSNRRASPLIDNCQTPPYALDPLYQYLPHGSFWEPACGKGNICEALLNRDRDGIGTDVLDGEEYDYFTYQPDQWDFSVTNPPFSIKYDWLRRSYELGKPFALLVPVKMIGAKKAQDLFKQYGFEWIFLNRRVNFEMPNKGYSGGGAQFPVFWLTWKFSIGQQVTFAEIEYPKK